MIRPGLARVVISAFTLVAASTGAIAQSEVFLPPNDEACADGATHRLQFDRAVPIRLKGKTPGITRQLDVLVGAFPVTVCGWYVQGPECDHLLVGTIVLPDEFVKTCGAALERLPPKSDDSFTDLTPTSDGKAPPGQNDKKPQQR